METPSRFDLARAVATWQQALQSQPGLSAADIPELAQHLEHSLAELQQLGLGSEEAFILATRRLGRPAEVADEFAKADPARYWRRCLFWAAGGALFANLWQVTLNYGLHQASDKLSPYWPTFPNSVAIPLAGLLDWAVLAVPLFLAIGWFLRRRVAATAVESRRLFQSRWRLAVAGLFLIAAAEGLQWWSIQSSLQQSGDGLGALLIAGYNIALYDGFFNNALWPVCLLALMVWLLPRRENASPLCGA